MGTNVSCCVVAVLASLLAFPPSAGAAEREVAAGYSLLGAPGGGVLPFGWFTSVAHRVNHHGLWTVVGASGHHRSNSHLFTIGTGARLSSAGKGPRLFGQFLAGLIVAGGHRSALGFILEPGAGIDVPLRPQMSLQMSASLPTVIGGDAGLSMVQIQLGVTVPLGRK